MSAVDSLLEQIDQATADGDYQEPFQYVPGEQVQHPNDFPIDEFQSPPVDYDISVEHSSYDMTGYEQEAATNQYLAMGEGGARSLDTDDPAYWDQFLANEDAFLVNTPPQQEEQVGDWRFSTALNDLLDSS